jgi:hypothetical protein
MLGFETPYVETFLPFILAAIEVLEEKYNSSTLFFFPEKKFKRSLGGQSTSGLHWSFFFKKKM